MPSGLLHRAPAIRDLLASGGESFSFEFMPAKTEADERQLWRAVPPLEPLRPTFVSGAYGAGGSPPGPTLPVTGRLPPPATLTPARAFTPVNPTPSQLPRLIRPHA